MSPCDQNNLNDADPVPCYHPTDLSGCGRTVVGMNCEWGDCQKPADRKVKIGHEEEYMLCGDHYKRAKGGEFIPGEQATED